MARELTMRRFGIGVECKGSERGGVLGEVVETLKW
jgi:hypothetical protein